VFLKIKKRFINLQLVRQIEANGCEIIFHFEPQDSVTISCESKVEVKMIMKTVEKNVQSFSAEL
jgi:hypothetical protein